MSSERDSAGAPAGAEAPAEIPERWSAQRKTELVLRLLRGETLDTVARESQVPAHELEEWRRVFLDGGTQGLKKRVDPEERELKRVQAKLGEVMMRLELAEGLLEKKCSWSGAHPRTDESGRLRRASAPESRSKTYWCHVARKKMDPSAASQAPQIVALPRW